MKKFVSYPLLAPVDLRGRLSLAWALLRSYVRCVYSTVADEIVAIVFVVCFLSFGMFVTNDFSQKLGSLQLFSNTKAAVLQASLDTALLFLLGAGMLYFLKVSVGRSGIFPKLEGKGNFILRLFSLTFLRSQPLFGSLLLGVVTPVLLLVILFFELESSRYLALSLTALGFWVLIQCFILGFWLSYFLDHLWWYRLLGLGYKDFLPTFLLVSLLLACSNLLYSEVFFLFFDTKINSIQSGDSTQSILIEIPFALAFSVLTFPMLSLLTEPRRGFSTGLYAWMYVILTTSLCLYSLWFLPVIAVGVVYAAVYQQHYFPRV